jgi:cephalosporin-C deacetylase
LAQKPPPSDPASAVRPPLTRPADFDAFWTSTLDTLASVPLDCRLGTATRAPEHRRLIPVRFRSFGDAEIQGYFLSADESELDHTPGPRPLVVTTHGYGSQSNPALEARHVQQLDLFCFDVRGYGLSRPGCAVDPRGYVLTGLLDPSTSLLRGAVCDFVRAAQVAQHVQNLAGSPIAFCGRSFGGALAFIAQAISGLANFLAVSVPTLGWAMGRRQLAMRGSSAEINDYVARVPADEAAVMRTLSYFDTVNFADRVTCPALVGVGRRDDIVPAETVYAIINHMSPPPEVIELPVSHSVEHDEAMWQGFDRRWTSVVRGLV